MGTGQYHHYKQQGRCPQCTKKHSGTYVFCNRCRVMRLSYQKTQYPPPEKYCLNCGKPIPAEGQRRPDRCLECRRTNRRAISRKAEKTRYSAGIRRRLDTNLRREYGIDLAEYEDMYTAQNGLCAICGIGIPKKDGKNGRGKFAIDHDHDTGKVRGILCAFCNFGIGNFKESVKTLESAILYLRHHSKPDPQHP